MDNLLMIDLAILLFLKFHGNRDDGTLELHYLFPQPKDSQDTLCVLGVCACVMINLFFLFCPVEMLEESPRKKGIFSMLAFAFERDGI